MKTVQECGHRCALRSYDWLTGLLLWNQSCSWPAFRPLFLPSSQTLHFSHGSGVRATDVLGNREGLQLGLYYQHPVGHKQLPSITAVLHVCQDTEILGSIRRKFFFLFFFSLALTGKENSTKMSISTQSQEFLMEQKKRISCVNQNSHTE